MVMCCDACDYIYIEEQGDLTSYVSPGTAWEDVPEDWECPICGLAKFAFVEYK